MGTTVPGSSMGTINSSPEGAEKEHGLKKNISLRFAKTTVAFSIQLN